MMQGIDAHIHLDLYGDDEAAQILTALPASSVIGVIAVSMHLASCHTLYQLQQQFPQRVFAAYGYHPEQEPPTAHEQEQLLSWMERHRKQMVAIGEIGLPYYLRKEAEKQNESFSMEPYLELLERFLIASKQWDKPVVLHAVYEDAEIACDLLAKHGVSCAHFHWFKGSPATVRRMIAAGYMVSITPDVLYEAEIQELVRQYPLELLMAETDGPWPFEGPFAGKQTHPAMIMEVIRCIAGIKSLSIEKVAGILLHNTVRFYRLNLPFKKPST